LLSAEVTVSIDSQASFSIYCLTGFEAYEGLSQTGKPPYPNKTVYNFIKPYNFPGLEPRRSIDECFLFKCPACLTTLSTLLLFYLV